VSLFSLLRRWWARAEPRAAVAAKPDELDQSSRGELDALLAKANGYLNCSDAHRAWACIADALEVAPQSAAAHALAGKVQAALNDVESALDHLTLALHFNPDDWQSAKTLSQLQERLGETGRALSVAEAFLARHPQHSGAISCLARIQYRVGRHEEALEHLMRVLSSSPDDVEALNLCGLIQAREFGRLREGEQFLYKAVRLCPDNLDAISNLGWVYSEEGRAAEALQCFDTVLSRNPRDHETRLMRSYAYLKSGEFAQGWRDFDARHFSPLAVKQERLLQSCGALDTLAGRGVLVRAEQGLGDQIMFASCFQDLLRVCRVCVIECDARLAPLFQRSFPGARVVGREHAGTNAVQFHAGVDCEMPMGSVPGLFRGAWSDFPMHSGYLKADPAKVEVWRARLAAIGPGPYVGISWLGGAPATRRQLRSVPLTLWKDVLLSRAKFISLQYGEVAAELHLAQQHYGVHVWHWPEAISDYEETAALIVALDLVVSVCTAVVHLAGSLGRPVLVLTPATPEWRYLAKGERMPWYPSVCLIRQLEGEQWGNVIPRVAAAIAKRLDAG
jgi:Flp pilus assembly protein TadD